jgi:molybdopterin/thiamine biosynthesis adenylyltransferase
MNRDRYLRQQGVEGLAVERLRSLAVCVVGAGAIGNEVVKNLALMGVGAIDVHDFDRVEIHNLTRSVFLREADVGANKAHAVAGRAREVDPNVRVDAHDGDFWRTMPLHDLARRDVVIAAVDSIEARMRISQLCALAGVDLVVAGIDSRYATVETFPFARGDAACYECHLPASAYAKVAERYSCGWLRRALAKHDVVPTTAITASVAGAFAVGTALRIDAATRDGARRLLVDTRSGTASTATLARNADCAGCGELQPRPRRVRADGDWRRALATHARGAAAVRISDPLIFGYGCARCGSAGEASRYVGRRADAFDDSIMRCAACGERSARIDIRAETDVGALALLFPDSPPPAKFLLAGLGGPEALCIDLEE